MKQDFTLFFEGNPLQPTTRNQAKLANEMQLARAEFARRFVHSHDIIADISCSSGFLSQLLPFHHYIGVDHPDVIALLMANGTYRGHSITYHAHDFEQRETTLDIGMQVDKIISFETIEHVEDPAHFLYNVGKNLKEGGQLILSTPNNPFGFPPRYKFHVKEYSLSEMHHLLAESGFDVQNTYAMGVPFELIRKALDKSSIKTYRNDPDTERGTLSKVMDALPSLRHLYCVIMPYDVGGAPLGHAGSGMIIIASKKA